MKKALFLIITTCLFFQTAFTTTFYNGGEITWECLPNGHYRFILKVYRECYQNGGPAANYSNSLTINSNVPGFSSINLTKIAGLSRDISPKCNSNSNFSHISCIGMTNPVPNSGAVEEHYFTSDYTYPNGVNLIGIPPANGWTFYYNYCCRTLTSNLINATNLGWKLRAIMYPFNNQNVSTCFDWSPSFAETPRTVFCSGHPVTFNYNAHDNELDSLLFSWGQPLNENGNPITTYVNGFSYNNPLPGSSFNSNNVDATINSQTGEISFTSFTTGDFITCVKVTAFKSGIKVSEIFREIKINIAPCGINTPPVVTPPFQNSTGQNIHFIDTVYAGQQINFQIQCFDFEFLPNGTPQTIELQASGLQFGAVITGVGATPPSMSDTSGCVKPPCATLFPAPNPPTQPLSDQGGLIPYFNWQTECQHLAVNAGCGSPSQIYNFVFTVFDDYCPVPGQSIKTVTILLLEKPATAPPDFHTLTSDSSGTAYLTWNKPQDSTGNFKYYLIYRSKNNFSGYTEMPDTIFNINTLSYNDLTANAQSVSRCYFIKTVSGCFAQFSQISDTLCIGTNIVIQEKKPFNQITCIPNPTSGKLQISYYSAVSGEVELKISDLTGKQIQTGKYNSKTGENTIQLDLSGLNDGVYFYSLKIENEVITKKFVIQK